MERHFKLGTRGSRLALKQVEEFFDRLRKTHPAFTAQIVPIDTYGDRDKKTPISSIEGTDFFTREIDNALCAGTIDLAVHSAKDLPDVLSPGLTIAATTAPHEQFDALVAKNAVSLDNLTSGAKIATSSVRRKTQLKKYREDFQIVDIRGTIEERLSILDNSAIDAVIIASCALVRLGLEHRITQRIPLDILIPHPLQGALAIMTRENDDALIKIISSIDGK